MDSDRTAAVTDVQQTLSYSSGKLSRRFLELGLVCLVLGGIIAYLGPPDLLSYDGMMLTFTFLVGGALTLYAVLRMFLPGKPLLMLSPAGVHIRIEWVKDILIPWREVRAVETANIEGRFRGHSVTFRDVTVLFVSRAFYDRRIHIDSWILRGPGWDTNFIPRGDLVQVVLHHEMLSTTAQDLRAAVEARWHAFRTVRGGAVPAVRGPEPDTSA